MVLVDKPKDNDARERLESFLPKYGTVRARAGCTWRTLTWTLISSPFLCPCPRPPPRRLGLACVAEDGTTTNPMPAMRGLSSGVWLTPNSVVAPAAATVLIKHVVPQLGLDLRALPFVHMRAINADALEACVAARVLVRAIGRPTGRTNRPGLSTAQAR